MSRKHGCTDIRHATEQNIKPNEKSEVQICTTAKIIFTLHLTVKLQQCYTEFN